MEKKDNKRALFIKNFPPMFSLTDKTELMRNFGANEVTLVGTNCGRAGFASEQEAEMALSRLHQMDILG